MLEKNETKLENDAPVAYEDLGKLPDTTAEQRQSLQRIFTNLFLSRFKSRTIQEINAMLRTLDVTKSRAGKELIAMGKAEGKAEGKTEGKAEMLLQILAKRFGKIPATIVSEIEHLNFLQLEKLGDQALEIADVKALSAWLKKVK